MRKAASNPEKMTSANYISKQLNVNRGLIHYWSVRLKLRYLKYNGVRYLDQPSALQLIKNLQARHNLDNDAVQTLKTEIEK